MSKNLFAERLRELRLERKLKLSDVGNFLGFSGQAISYYEYGKREPKITELILLADYFNVSIDYLVGRIDTK